MAAPSNADSQYSNPIAGLDRPVVIQRLRLPAFCKEGIQPYAPTAFIPGNIPDTHFCWRLSRLRSHSAAGRIMSMKNSNDTIGNRTRKLPACSAGESVCAVKNTVKSTAKDTVKGNLDTVQGKYRTQ